jgi:hypothetical protein
LLATLHPSNTEQRRSTPRPIVLGAAGGSREARLL